MACPRRIGSLVAAVAARPREPSHPLPNRVQVQLFGRRESRAAQRALRFFSERRVEVAFVDISRKPMALGELRRFSQKFGASALMDRESALYRETGMAYLSMNDEETFDRLLADQRLLKLPLTRAGAQLSVGVDEDAWRAWLAVEP